MWKVLRRGSPVGSPGGDSSRGGGKRAPPSLAETRAWQSEGSGLDLASRGCLPSEGQAESGTQEQHDEDSSRGGAQNKNSIGKVLKLRFLSARPLPPPHRPPSSRTPSLLCYLCDVSPEAKLSTCGSFWRSKGRAN